MQSQQLVFLVILAGTLVLFSPVGRCTVYMALGAVASFCYVQLIRCGNSDPGSIGRQKVVDHGPRRLMLNQHRAAGMIDRLAECARSEEGL